MAITYNVTPTNAAYVYRTTGGGVTFSANLTATAAFDYFTDTAVVNDALYVAKAAGQTTGLFSDINFNVGTALAGTGITGIWEYYNAVTTSWMPVLRLVDNTVGFTATGAKIVQFPYQENHAVLTVNSVSAGWVRYRLTAITTITEGGANQTTAVQVNDGKLSTGTGYTSGSPCTFTLLRDYMNTNYPYVACQKMGRYFDFRWVSLQISSPLLTTRETIETGIGSTLGYNILNVNGSFAYLISGTKVGSYNGKNGSVFMINAIANSVPFVWGTNAKCYDTSFLSFQGTAGYPAISGEFLDCNFEIAPGALAASTSVYNSRFQLGSSGFIAGSWDASSPFINNKLLITGSAAWGSYQSSWSIRNMDYAFDSPSGKGLINVQQTQNSSVFDYVNPLTPLPRIDAADGSRPILRSTGTASDMLNVFFYDDSAGTYTDYTAAAASSATADVPINGDVGDILYLNINGATTDLRWAEITSTIGGTNDYVYAFEYYYSGSWREFTTVWDTTANLTKTGILWGERIFNGMSALTVNSVAGYWYRIRIVTKGTGTPAVDKIRRVSSSGVSRWEIWERYELNTTAYDSAGAVLAGVEAYATDVDGASVYTGTTDANGLIAATALKGMKWYFDPINTTNCDTVNDVCQKNYNPFALKYRKYGYVPQSLSVTMTSIQNLKPIFSTNTYVVANQATAHAYTGIDVDGATKTITLSEDHTMQEVYDYCQDWFSLTANMAYAEPFITYDGVNFTSTYDLIITADLTGTGKINIGTKTLTLSGSSTLDIVDVTGTYTNIKLTGLEAGSRVQLYDDTNDVELYNAVVAGTTLTFPKVWTVDLDLRIRVMWVSTVTAKSWYSATGTFANTGFTLQIAQTDDAVYNAIGIDGSTVTECAIVGTTLVVQVDDPDNTTTGQRIYAFEVAWLFTEGGIRDQSLYITATDMTHFTFYGGLKIKNMDTVNPLNLTGANIVPESGAVTDVFDLSNGASIALNFNRVEGFSYSSGSGLSPEEHNALLAQKATIDTNLDAKVSKTLTVGKFLGLK